MQTNPARLSMIRFVLVIFALSTILFVLACSTTKQDNNESQISIDPTKDIFSASTGFKPSDTDNLVIYLTDVDSVNYIALSFVEDLQQRIDRPKSFPGHTMHWNKNGVIKEKLSWNWSNMTKKGGRSFKFAYSKGFMVELDLDRVVEVWGDLVEANITNVRKHSWGGSAKKHKIGIDSDWAFVLNRADDHEPNQNNSPTLSTPMR